MKVLVAVKRVVDYNVRIRVKSDGSGVDTDNVVMSMNPFDENGLEEALRMKQAGIATEVIAVSVGDEKSQDTLRSALAMGADRAILIKADQTPEPLGIAKLLAKVVEQEGPQVAILGKQAIDDDSNQTGQMLAALLDWPQGTFASNAQFDGDAINLTRETDTGLETIKISLPAVITTDLRLNDPRLPKLPDIMKAKKKPIDIVDASSYGIDLTPRLELVSVAAPAERDPGIIVADAAELVNKLKEVGAL
ncbi:MAG: electron transfer flavoprotein beta subunit [Cocleimonas sp.]|jgi:electron transfer flavoprotein beta subunit